MTKKKVYLNDGDEFELEGRTTVKLDPNVPGGFIVADMMDTSGSIYLDEIDERVAVRWDEEQGRYYYESPVA